VPCDCLSDIAALAHDCGISEERDDLLLASRAPPRINFARRGFRLLPSCIDQCLRRVRHISLRLHNRRPVDSWAVRLNLTTGGPHDGEAEIPERRAHHHGARADFDTEARRQESRVDAG
jgi:hypothetical protein